MSCACAVAIWEAKSSSLRGSSAWLFRSRLTIASNSLRRARDCSSSGDTASDDSALITPEAASALWVKIDPSANDVAVRNDRRSIAGYSKLLMIEPGVRLRGAQALGKLNRVLINNSKGVRRRRERFPRCPPPEFAMKIHEYQGKELLKKFGVPVPRGIVARSVDEAYQAAKDL